jgi:hypothetical protein
MLKPEEAAVGIDARAWYEEVRGKIQIDRDDAEKA